MKHVLCSALVASSVFISGCATTSVQSVDPKGKPAAAVVTTGIDPRDLNEVVSRMVDSINKSGVLNQFDGREKPPVISVSTLINNTTERLDTRNLTSGILASLQDKATEMINRGVGPDGKPRPEDAAALGRAQRARWQLDEKRAVDPDLTLSGEIRLAYTTNGKFKVYNYSFHFRLTDGEIVKWQDIVDIQKIAKRSGPVGI